MNGRFFKVLRQSLLAGWVVCFSMGVAAAATLHGQQFEEQAQLGRQELRLNGLGVRSIFIFKAYVAGLYLTQRTADPVEVLRQPGPKRLQMKMMMGAGAKDIKQAFVDGMRKNVSPEQWETLQPRVQQFSGIVDAIGQAHKGDVINLDYLPERGLVLSVNARQIEPAISGADFYETFLKIFVGDDPVDTRLKNGLLGKSPQ